MQFETSFTLFREKSKDNISIHINHIWKSITIIITKSWKLQQDYMYFKIIIKKGSTQTAFTLVYKEYCCIYILKMKITNFSSLLNLRCEGKRNLKKSEFYLRKWLVTTPFYSSVTLILSTWHAHLLSLQL